MLHIFYAFFYRNIKSKDIENRNSQHTTRPVIYFIINGTLGKMETSFERYRFSSDLKNQNLVELVNSDIFLKRDKTGVIFISFIYSEDEQQKYIAENKKYYFQACIIESKHPK